MHKRAVSNAQEQARADALQVDSTMQAAAPEENALASATRENPSSVRASDVVFLRAVVETRGSFRDFEKLFAAAVAANQDLRDHIMNRALARDLLGGGHQYYYWLRPANNNGGLSIIWTGSSWGGPPLLLSSFETTK